MKRFILERPCKLMFTAIVIMSCVLLPACSKTKNVEESIVYSELKADDMELIDNINQNIDCNFKLLEEMDVDGKPDEGPYVEYSPGYGEVKSYGVDVPEKNAPIRTNIYIIKSSDDYSIFGVKYGQKYTKAKELVEQAGFTLIKEGSFNSNTYALTYAKEIAYIEMEIEYEYGETFEDGNVSRIGIRIPIQE